MFEKKRRTHNILKTLGESAPSSPAILDGDEDAATPVEAHDLGKLARLQPFSPVAIALLRLFDREDTDIREIVKLVQSDAALAAETLACVNSPLFAVRQEVSDLHCAITVLGADHTRSLATMLAMRSMLRSAPKPNIVRRLWRHSIATAVIASDLAPVYGVAAELAYTAGVLHDVGRFGLLAQDGDAYGRLVLGMFDNVEAVLRAERELCSLDHCQVGGYLCQGWQLPLVFQVVAARHHEAKGQSGILGLLHAACAMADDLSFAAVSHQDFMSLDDRLADSVPEALREPVKTRWLGADQRIMDTVKALDF